MGEVELAMVGRRGSIYKRKEGEGELHTMGKCIYYLTWQGWKQ